MKYIFDSLDLDCLMLRGHDNALTPTQQQCFVDFFTLHNGFSFGLGDNLTKLEKTGMDSLGSLTLSSNATPTNHPPFINGLPQFISQSLGNNSLLGVFNWQDFKRSITVDPGKWKPTAGERVYFRDYWSKIKFGPYDTKFKLKLKPFESRLFEIVS
jgi:hypothetical protein